MKDIPLSEDIIQTTSNAIQELNKSKTLKDLEDKIKEIISSQIETNLLEIKILDKSEKTYIETENSLLIPLKHRGKTNAYFYANFDNNESKTNAEEFIKNLSGVISIVHARNSYLENIKRTKKMWEATFDAIEDPLALIDSEYNILQSNKSYDKRLPDKKRLPETKCYVAFADRISPCPSCSLLSALTEFDMDNYRVYAYPISHNLHVLRYKDLTRKKQFESNIAIASGLAEAGILAGSIAHEINNPLAGILTFLNLVEMDTNADDHNLIKLKEMEAMVLECKKIVEKILLLARKGDKSYQDIYLIQNLLDEVLVIINPESKLREVVIEYSTEDEIPPSFCFPHLMRQIFLTILQSAIKSLIGSENRKIQIALSFDKKNKIISVKFRSSTKIEISELDRVLLDSFLEDGIGEISSSDNQELILNITYRKNK